MIQRSTNHNPVHSRRDELRQHARDLLHTGPTLPPSGLLPPPSLASVVDLVDRARTFLFPYQSGAHRGDVKGRSHERLEVFDVALTRLIRLAFAAHCVSRGTCDTSQVEAEDLSLAFIRRMPELRATLVADVQAAFDGDPSLYSTDEAILCYPGITAVMCYRLAHVLYELEVPLLPRMMTEHAHTLTGIDIHPGATIGKSFFIDHGTGVVIGATAIIGDRVRLYQGVTLGAKSMPTDAEGIVRKGEPRHPILEDDVVIYSWASILGRVTIGCGSVIGGNVWVTRDVPPGSLVTQAKTERIDCADGGGI
jgi:serine O-acetyltransferase